ncbi:MAG TPA: hypothetical protein VJ826_04525 [Candidatus Polarisedimenticolaceae bacterium]|nr:hypothetical protein [Candidatus Polarisedimenticolaceae bacterium]
MSELAVMDAPTIETPAPTPETPAPTIPERTPPRFLAGLRFNGLRYLALVSMLALSWGFIRLATWEGIGHQESTFLYLLAGGMVAAAAKTGLDLLTWAEANRQAIHLERVRAVQRVFQKACTVRDQAVSDWRRIHTVLVDNLSGERKELRFFHDHDETDRQVEKLLGKAQAEETWIRTEGVDAVRRFRKDVRALDYKDLVTEPEFIEAFGAHLERLRRDLAVAALGVGLG